MQDTNSTRVKGFVIDWRPIFRNPLKKGGPNPEFFQSRRRLALYQSRKSVLSTRG